MSPEEYRQRAISNYADGADGLCFWDTYNRNAYRKEYSMVRRLGHKDDLAEWDDGSGDYYRSRKLLSVGGYVLDKYPPALGLLILDAPSLRLVPYPQVP